MECNLEKVSSNSLTQGVKFIWLDGKLIPWEKGQVHFLTHSLHYGSAIFEGIRFYETKNGPAIFRLDDHLKRFFFSAKTLDMRLPYSRAEIKKAIIELVKKNELKNGYIRPMAFYGKGMGLSPKGVEVGVGIACWKWDKFLGKEVVRVKISSFARIHPQSSSMGAKISGHYFNSILASIDIKKHGFDEALLLDWRGNIAEGPGENIFFVKGRQLVTPKLGAILPGITRETIMWLAKDSGYQVVEADIKPGKLKSFDEAFFTGTAVEVTAIGEIDREKFGAGKIGKTTLELREKYHQLTRGSIGKYAKWLSYTKCVK